MDNGEMALEEVALMFEEMGRECMRIAEIMRMPEDGVEGLEELGALLTNKQIRSDRIKEIVMFMKGEDDE